jgi:hypothetical protein
MNKGVMIGITLAILFVLILVAVTTETSAQERLASEAALLYPGPSPIFFPFVPKYDAGHPVPIGFPQAVP